MNTHKYYIIYKPYGMLCQFTREDDKPVLGDVFAFPKDVYPLGRLDTDSEGLLILSNDKQLNHFLLNPEFKHSRTYLVQVEGIFNEAAIQEFRQGIVLNLKGEKYKTLPAHAEIIEEPSFIHPRNPPVRFRKNIPTSWIKICLHEGKNRQVRKMTAQAGFPTLRLIRIAIEKLPGEHMKPGEVSELSRKEIYRLLSIPDNRPQGRKA